MDARRTLEAAREAVEDAERCRRQLNALDTAKNQHIADLMRRRLEQRMGRDEAARASAAELIYSSDELTDRQCDVLIHRSVMGRTWPSVARALGRGVRPCQIDRNEALEALGRVV
jgi:uncharacterized lipoprotein